MPTTPNVPETAGRRRTDQPIFTADDAKLLGRLDVAVFGLDGATGTGMVNDVTGLRVEISKLKNAVVTAAISFGFGSFAVAIAIATGG